MADTPTTAMRAIDSPSAADKPSQRRRRRTLYVGVVVILAALVAVVYATSSGASSSGADAASTTESSSASRRATNGTASSAKRRPVIAVFGDSTTQYGAEPNGWEVLLHSAYKRSTDTINRGLSGYNTRVFLKYAMPGIIEEFENYYTPTVAVVWFGVNDATLANGPNKAQHIDVDEYKTNLKEIITQMRDASPTAKVLLLSPCYIDEKQRLASMLKQGRKEGDPLDRNNEETVKYAAACTELASELSDDANVGYLNIYDYFLTNYPSDAQRADVLRDGLHFSDNGNKVFYQIVKDKIETMVAPSVLNANQFPDDSLILHY